jgi:hypothetical protein
MGRRGRVREPRRWSSWGKHVASRRREIRGGALTRGAMPAGLTAGKSPIPCPQENPLGRTLVPVPITDTGGQVEHIEVSELTLVKELGKIAP